MGIRTWLLRAAALFVSCWAVHAAAATTVEVLDAHPAGSSVVLGRGERFCLRLAYASDTPVGIWITPYYRGKRVNAGTNPSTRLSGRGETIAWFFFMQPGDRVDEIRITAGDGGTHTTPVVATYAVDVVGSSESRHTQAPAWVADLDARARAAQRQAIEAYYNQPTSVGDVVLVTGFMVAVLVLGLGGLVAPVWLFFRWRGKWRIAVGVPAAVAALVVLRIAIDVARDPTSHNLWPFEVLMTGPACAVAVAVLVLARRWAARSEAPSSPDADVV